MKVREGVPVHYAPVQILELPIILLVGGLVVLSLTVNQHPETTNRDADQQKKRDIEVDSGLGGKSIQAEVDCQGHEQSNQR